MSLGFSRFGCCLALLGFALSGAIGPRLQAQGTQRPHRDIELSETNSAEILTNLNQLSSKKEGVTQLEDQLRTLNQFTPKMLQGGFNTTYVPPRAIPAKTIQELLDRQRFWGMTPEEFSIGTAGSDKYPFSASSEDSFSGKRSSLQQFYDALNGSGTGRKNSTQNTENNLVGSKNKDSDSQDTDFVDDSSLPAGVRDKAKRLQDFLNKNPSSMFNSASKPRTTLDKFLGFSEPNPAAEAARGPKSSMESFMEQFKKVLDNQTAGVRVDATVSALVAPAATALQPGTPYPSLDSLPSSPHREVTQTTTPGTINTIPNPTTMQDINSAALNAWNPLYTPPKLELPKSTPPAPPDLQFPRRKF